MEWTLLVISLGVGGITQPQMAWINAYQDEAMCEKAVKKVESRSSNLIKLMGVCVPRPGHKH